jgi:Mor family transcriptional regulator
MDVIDRFSEIICECGIEREKAEKIADRMRHEYAGERVYIPVISGNEKQKMINDLLMTGNHKKVAKKYRVSLSTTYRIMRRIRNYRK